MGILYTRGGDKGETSLYSARRVPKDSARVEAYGTIDELNSCIGVAVAFSERKEIRDPLKRVQSRLFAAGADLATDVDSSGAGKRAPRIGKADTEELEKMIDALQKELPRLTSFILPGGNPTSAAIQVARAVCRRAERRCVSLARSEKVNQELVPFLNRLSTYLFNLARYANLLEGAKDEVWSPS